MVHLDMISSSVTNIETKLADIYIKHAKLLMRIYVSRHIFHCTYLHLFFVFFIIVFGIWFFGLPWLSHWLFMYLEYIVIHFASIFLSCPMPWSKCAKIR